MRMSFGHMLIALFLCLLLGSQSAWTQSRGISVNLNEKRIALVIGNADYKTAPLRNPVNDARSISKMLKRLGFEVIKAENAGYRQIRRAVIEFGRLPAIGCRSISLLWKILKPNPAPPPSFLENRGRRAIRFSYKGRFDEFAGRNMHLLS